MLVLLLLLAVVTITFPTSVLAGNEVTDVIKDELDIWNLFARCYGEAQLTKFAARYQKVTAACLESRIPTTTLPDNEPLIVTPSTEESIRNIRNALTPSGAHFSSFLPNAAGGASRRRFSRQVVVGLLEPTAEDFAEFFAQAQEYKAGMQSKLGNLSCVLTTMGMLDASGNINLKHYTEDMWALIGQNGGGKDPAFVQKMQNGFVDCYNVAQAWPQSSLDRNPITKQWGRQMVFFHCVKKIELKTCSQLQLKEYIELMYGPIDMARMPEFNGDKYEAALFGMKVMLAKQTPEEEMVRNFLWGSPNRAA